MSKNNVITFKKPYSFEGKEYKEVDLSGLENLTGKDLTDADRIFVSAGNVAPMNEMSIGYACIIAAKATGLPQEFFEGLPAKEIIKVKNEVMTFFFD